MIKPVFKTKTNSWDSLLFMVSVHNHPQGDNESNRQKYIKLKVNSCIYSSFIGIQGTIGIRALLA